jgi:leucyl aminopeptidase
MKKIVLLLSFTLFIFGVGKAQISDFDLQNMLDCIHKDSLMRTVQDMEDFETRMCTQTVGQNRQVAEYLVNRLKQYGIEDAKIDSFYVEGSSWFAGDYAQFMYNVSGTLKGSGATDSTVIIGAHLDAVSFIQPTPPYLLTSTSPGADDNATGCAVMIEMARVIHENQWIPHHNIDFMAYDAEEIGLMGSYYDARKRREANENVIVMLNNDMVANQSESIPWKVTLYKYSNSFDITEKAVQALNNYTSVTPQVISSNSAGSDSYPYYQNNYKTTFAIENDFSPYYHSTNDLTEHLNFEYCRQIARMNCVLLAHYAFNYSMPNSIQDNRLSENIEVYPVPANDFIIVLNHNIKIDKINMLDFSGRTIESLSDLVHQQNIIRLDNYKRGIYFMVLHTDKGVMTKKIIKQ